MICTFVFVAMFLMQSGSFRETQLTHSRVKAAYQDKAEIVENYFTRQQLSYAGFHLFIRGFKKEKDLEVWVKEAGKETYNLLTTYAFCSISGDLGPKRKEGDLQIPEGVYQLNHFNPKSNFHLSLGINYPNASDRILSDRKNPGSAIYIHGNCVTIGCIPITDDKIKELYILAVEARNNGQSNIPVHIFPTRLNDQGIDFLKQNFNASTEKIKFWKNLQVVFKDFENTRQLKNVKTDIEGQYYF